MKSKDGKKHGRKGKNVGDKTKNAVLAENDSKIQCEQALPPENELAQNEFANASKKTVAEASPSVLLAEAASDVKKEPEGKKLIKSEQYTENKKVSENDEVGKIPVVIQQNRQFDNENKESRIEMKETLGSVDKNKTINDVVNSVEVGEQIFEKRIETFKEPNELFADEILTKQDVPFESIDKEYFKAPVIPNISNSEEGEKKIELTSSADNAATNQTNAGPVEQKEITRIPPSMENDTLDNLSKSQETLSTLIGGEIAKSDSNEGKPDTLGSQEVLSSQYLINKDSEMTSNEEISHFHGSSEETKTADHLNNDSVFKNITEIPPLSKKNEVFTEKCLNALEDEVVLNKQAELVGTQLFQPSAGYFPKKRLSPPFHSPQRVDSNNELDIDTVSSLTTAALYNANNFLSESLQNDEKANDLTKALNTVQNLQQLGPQPNDVSVQKELLVDELKEVLHKTKVFSTTVPEMIEHLHSKEKAEELLINSKLISVEKDTTHFDEKCKKPEAKSLNNEDGMLLTNDELQFQTIKNRYNTLTAARLSLPLEMDGTESNTFMSTKLLEEQPVKQVGKLNEPENFADEKAATPTKVHGKILNDELSTPTDLQLMKTQKGMEKLKVEERTITETHLDAHPQQNEELPPEASNISLVSQRPLKNSMLKKDVFVNAEGDEVEGVQIKENKELEEAYITVSLEKHEELSPEILELPITQKSLILEKFQESGATKPMYDVSEKPILGPVVKEQEYVATNVDIDIKLMPSEESSSYQKYLKQEEQKVVTVGKILSEKNETYEKEYFPSELQGSESNVIGTIISTYPDSELQNSEPFTSISTFESSKTNDVVEESNDAEELYKYETETSSSNLRKHDNSPFESLKAFVPSEKTHEVTGKNEENHEIKTKQIILDNDEEEKEGKYANPMEEMSKTMVDFSSCLQLQKQNELQKEELFAEAEKEGKGTIKNSQVKNMIPELPECENYIDVNKQNTLEDIITGATFTHPTLESDIEVSEVFSRRIHKLGKEADKDDTLHDTQKEESLRMCSVSNTFQTLAPVEPDTTNTLFLESRDNLLDSDETPYQTVLLQKQMETHTEALSLEFRPSYLETCNSEVKEKASTPKSLELIQENETKSERLEKVLTPEQAEAPAEQDNHEKDDYSAINERTILASSPSDVKSSKAYSKLESFLSKTGSAPCDLESLLPKQSSKEITEKEMPKEANVHIIMTLEKQEELSPEILTIPLETLLEKKVAGNTEEVEEKTMKEEDYKAASEGVKLDDESRSKLSLAEIITSVSISPDPSRDVSSKPRNTILKDAIEKYDTPSFNVMQEVLEKVEGSKKDTRTQQGAMSTEGQQQLPLDFETSLDNAEMSLDTYQEDNQRKEIMPKYIADDGKDGKEEVSATSTYDKTETNSIAADKQLLTEREILDSVNPVLNEEQFVNSSSLELPTTHDAEEMPFVDQVNEKALKEMDRPYEELFLLQKENELPHNLLNNEKTEEYFCIEPLIDQKTTINDDIKKIEITETSEDSNVTKLHSKKDDKNGYVIQQIKTESLELLEENMEHSNISGYFEFSEARGLAHVSDKLEKTVGNEPGTENVGSGGEEKRFVNEEVLPKTIPKNIEGVWDDFSANSYNNYHFERESVSCTEVNWSETISNKKQQPDTAVIHESISVESSEYSDSKKENQKTDTTISVPLQRRTDENEFVERIITEKISKYYDGMKKINVENYSYEANSSVLPGLPAEGLQKNKKDEISFSRPMMGHDDIVLRKYDEVSHELFFRTPSMENIPISQNLYDKTVAQYENDHSDFSQGQFEKPCSVNVTERSIPVLNDKNETSKNKNNYEVNQMNLLSGEINLDSQKGPLEITTGVNLDVSNDETVYVNTQSLLNREDELRHTLLSSLIIDVIDKRNQEKIDGIQKKEQEIKLKRYESNDEVTEAQEHPSLNNEIKTEDENSLAKKTESLEGPSRQERAHQISVIKTAVLRTSDSFETLQLASENSCLNEGHVCLTSEETSEVPGAVVSSITNEGIKSQIPLGKLIVKESQKTNIVGSTDAKKKNTDTEDENSAVLNYIQEQIEKVKDEERKCSEFSDDTDTDRYFQIPTQDYLDNIEHDEFQLQNQQTKTVPPKLSEKINTTEPTLTTDSDRCSSTEKQIRTFKEHIESAAKNAGILAAGIALAPVAVAYSAATKSKKDQTDLNNQPTAIQQKFIAEAKDESIRRKDISKETPPQPQHNAEDNKQTTTETPASPRFGEQEPELTRDSLESVREAVEAEPRVEQQAPVEEKLVIEEDTEITTETPASPMFEEQEQQLEEGTLESRKEIVDTEPH
uniref:Transforming acidic coiled-coil-containing protein 2 n=1 Tax=Syphacia muris TaxID=451379 RepID=A0A0N5ATH9_9BILA